jgi:hypothetical protein
VGVGAIVGAFVGFVIEPEEDAKGFFAGTEVKLAAVLVVVDADDVDDVPETFELVDSVESCDKLSESSSSLYSPIAAPILSSSSSGIPSTSYIPSSSRNSGSWLLSI